MQIIDDLEPTKRGVYGGVVGYVDFSGNLDTAIAIRTMVVTPDGRASVQAGAGIVADSDPDEEDVECHNKAAALLAAVPAAAPATARHAGRHRARADDRRRRRRRGRRRPRGLRTRGAGPSSSTATCSGVSGADAVEYLQGQCPRTSPPSRWASRPTR